MAVSLLFSFFQLFFCSFVLFICLEFIKYNSMLKRYFFVKIYPTLFLIYKPLLISMGAILLFIWIGVQLGLFRAPLISSDPFEAVPSTSTLILKVKRHEFQKNIKNTVYFNDLKGFAPFETWITELGIIDSLFDNDKSKIINNDKTEFTSALLLNGSNDFAWLHIIELKSKKLNIGKLAKELGLLQEDESNYLGSKIFEFNHSVFGKWTICQSRGLLLISRQTTLVEAAIAALNNTGNNLPFDSYFSEVRTYSKDQELTVYLNMEMTSIFLSLLGPNASLSSEPVLKNMAWTGGTVKFEKSNFVLGGKISLKSSIGLLNWLSNQKAIKLLAWGNSYLKILLFFVS